MLLLGSSYLSAYTNLEKSGSEENYLSNGEDVDLSKAASVKAGKRIDVDLQITRHLTQYISVFSTSDRSNPTLMRVENLLAMRKWVLCTQLCRQIGDSPFIHLNNSEVKNLFLEKGLCVGGVVQHFSQFFKIPSAHLSPQNTAPFPVRASLQVNLEEVGIKFYPFEVNRDSLEMQTKHLRFLQVVYKTSYAIKSVESLEFFSPSILRNQGLKVQKRIPDLRVSKEIALKITELLPTLKDLAEQDHPDTGYLLGIKGERTSHAIALYLKTPYHFMDLPHGVAVADNLEQFTLFLTVYLTEKYTTFSSFSLLEFLSIPK